MTTFLIILNFQHLTAYLDKPFKFMLEAFGIFVDEVDFEYIGG